MARIENRTAKGKFQKSGSKAITRPMNSHGGHRRLSEGVNNFSVSSLANFLFLLPTAPQKPRGDGAIWPPAALFGDLLDLGGGREMIEPIKPFDRAPYAQIADRQHVHTAERKDQKHMRRPDADALDLREHRDHFVIAHLRDA